MRVDLGFSSITLLVRKEYDKTCHSVFKIIFCPWSQKSLGSLELLGLLHLLHVHGTRQIEKSYSSRAWHQTNGRIIFFTCLAPDKQKNYLLRLPGTRPIEESSSSLAWHQTNRRIIFFTCVAPDKQKNHLLHLLGARQIEESIGMVKPHHISTIPLVCLIIYTILACLQCKRPYKAGQSIESEALKSNFVKAGFSKQINLKEKIVITDMLRSLDVFKLCLHRTVSLLLQKKMITIFHF